MMVLLGDGPKLKVFRGVEEREPSMAWSSGMPKVELPNGLGVGFAGGAAVLMLVAGKKAEKL